MQPALGLKEALRLSESYFQDLLASLVFLAIPFIFCVVVAGAASFIVKHTSSGCFQGSFSGFFAAYLVLVGGPFSPFFAILMLILTSFFIWLASSNSRNKTNPFSRIQAGTTCYFMCFVVCSGYFLVGNFPTEI